MQDKSIMCPPCKTKKNENQEKTSSDEIESSLLGKRANPVQRERNTQLDDKENDNDTEEEEEEEEEYFGGNPVKLKKTQSLIVEKKETNINYAQKPVGALKLTHISLEDSDDDNNSKGNLDTDMVQETKPKPKPHNHNHTNIGLELKPGSTQHARDPSYLKTPKRSIDSYYHPIKPTTSKLGNN